MIPLTQFAFNATVRLNVEDFEIPWSEAIDMTVEEYKVQSRDLSFYVEHRVRFIKD